MCIRDSGYAIYVEETEYNSSDDAYRRQLQGSSSAFGSDKAALITYDGKMKTADTKDDYTSDFSNYSRNEVQIGSTNSEIVLVKETSNGEYRLKDLDTKNPQISTCLLYTSSSSGQQFKTAAVEVPTAAVRYDCQLRPVLALANRSTVKLYT